MIYKRKHTMKKLRLIVLFVLTAIVLASCVDEDSRLGLGLVGDNGAVNVFKEDNPFVSVESQVFKDDSLTATAHRSIPLGSYRDNNFGRVSTCIYAQISLSTPTQNFTNLGTADSLVLTLAYAGSFGKDNNVNAMDMHIVVNELTEEFDTTKTRANDDIAYSNTPIFEGDVNVNVFDTNIVLANDNNTYNPHLRLKLSNEFIDKLMSKSYETAEDFMQDFKGIRISATNTDANGMIAFVDLSSSISGITLYYTTNNGTKSKYKLNFPTSGNVLVHIDKDYSGTPLAGFASSITSEEYLATSEYMYIGALGVAGLRLNILGLDNWYNVETVKNAAINRAELILPVADISGDKSTYPFSLLCYRKDDEKSIYTKDQMIASSIGGTTYYDSTINAYRILITSHIQNFLNGKYKEPTIYIIAEPQVSSAARVVLNGPNYSDPTKRPKLNITYSHPTNK